MEFTTDIFSRFNEKWSLLTAGTGTDYNCMTISWGGLGTLWGKPVATVYVKPIRYTWQYMEKYGAVTVSFFPEEYRGDLMTLGSKSGRDGDKVALTRLTPTTLEQGVTIAQAETILVCRKIYWQDLVRENMPPEVAERIYTPEEPHRMYIGEVMDIIRK